MLHAPTSETEHQSGRSHHGHSARPASHTAPRQDRLAELQRAYGNQAVLRMLDRSRAASTAAGTLAQGIVQREGPRLQMKALTINKPGDAFEQEADRVAGQVMGMAEPQAPVEIAGGSALQRSAADQAAPATVPAIVHEVLRSPGQPLDAATRAFMEPRFGRDFSTVRVHADANAAKAASSVNARAFAASQSIVFGAGEYAPETESGGKLLAHELTHVVQGGDVHGAIRRQCSDAELAATVVPVKRRTGYGVPSISLTSGEDRRRAEKACCERHCKLDETFTAYQDENGVYYKERVAENYENFPVWKSERAPAGSHLNFTHAPEGHTIYWWWRGFQLNSNLYGAPIAIRKGLTPADVDPQPTLKDTDKPPEPPPKESEGSTSKPPPKESGGRTSKPPPPPKELERVTSRGAKIGTRMNITLTWNTTDDLDLRLITPSRNEIYYDNKNADGGTLNLDANVFGTSKTPAENILFNTVPVPGVYAVRVQPFAFYESKAGGVKFTVTILIDGVLYQKIDGVTGSKAKSNVDVLSFPYPLKKP
jgi:hypothetical protein